MRIDRLGIPVAAVGEKDAILAGMSVDREVVNLTDLLASLNILAKGARPEHLNSCLIRNTRKEARLGQRLGRSVDQDTINARHGVEFISELTTLGHVNLSCSFDNPRCWIDRYIQVLSIDTQASEEAHKDERAVHTGTPCPKLTSLPTLRRFAVAALSTSLSTRGRFVLRSIHAYYIAAGISTQWGVVTLLHQYGKRQVCQFSFQMRNRLVDLSVHGTQLGCMIETTQRALGDATQWFDDVDNIEQRDHRRITPQNEPTVPSPLSFDHAPPTQNTEHLGSVLLRNTGLFAKRRTGRRATTSLHQQHHHSQGVFGCRGKHCVWPSLLVYV